MAIQTATRPEHRIYLRVAPGHTSARLTAIHVVGAEQKGTYFCAPLPGSTPEERAQSAVLTAVQSVPSYCTLYIHCQDRTVRNLLRDKLPKSLAQEAQRRSVSVRIGHIEYYSLFWSDLVQAVDGGQLPEVGPLNDYQLYTYAVCDSLQTYGAGLLYGNGQIFTHSQRRSGSELAGAELDAVHWAFTLLPPGKVIEVHHHNPEMRDFWEKDARQFTDTYPATEDAARGIGEEIERKSLRFNLPNLHQDNALARGVRTLAGRRLA